MSSGVISRLYAIETPLPDSKPEIRALTQALVPQARAGDFAQALMDLGATICTPKSPNCLICPWTEHCEGRRTGLAPSLPRKKKKRAVPVRRGVATGWSARMARCCSGGGRKRGCSAA